MSSSIFLKRPKHLPKLLSTLVLSRSMGGGPRTFPGGLNKWQWKRMHEKRARDKERVLLHQEKELYQARIRSQIRANVAGKPDPFKEPGTGPMSPESHVKALADRFMKEGAEDLWNERDGPIKPPTPQPNDRRRSIIREADESASFDLRKEFVQPCNSAALNRGNLNYSSNLSGNRVRARHYSVQGFRNGRNEVSVLAANRESSKLERSSSNLSENRRISAKKQRRYFRHNESSSEFDSEDDELAEYDVKKMGSSASLGKYDVKITKRRIPLNSLEKEIDLSEQIESIRHEIKKKNLLEGEEGKDKEEEESILSEKRFDEFDISPLTIKALQSAGYIHTTREQEAALSVCLEGKDALVKARAGTGKTAAFLF